MITTRELLPSTVETLLLTAAALSNLYLTRRETRYGASQARRQGESSTQKTGTLYRIEQYSTLGARCDPGRNEPAGYRGDVRF
jgi:hypothetical protein